MNNNNMKDAFFWNISDEILEYALSKGLSPISTGGHCDFVALERNDGYVLIVGNVEDGQTPDKLDEPSYVSLYNFEWDQGVFFNREGWTAKDCIDFVASFTGLEIEFWRVD